MNSDQSKEELAEKKTPGVDGSIRIKSGLRISVNDAGDEIFLPVENTQFIEDFYEMLDIFYEINKNIKSKAGLEKSEMVKSVKEDIKKLTTEFDRLFGDGCCQKVFGSMVPSPYVIADFFDQLIPIINKYAGDRKARLAEKYGPNRQMRRRNKKKRRQQS